MSEFTVCRTLDTHPALRYCLLLDDMRIAGGKPDYRGDNILISWHTKETYGSVDAIKSENKQLATEKAALERRIDELCQENERLRADQAHWELGNCPSCPNVVSLQEALEQNSKLCAEVERGKAEFKKMDVWHSQELKAALAENVKLREQVGQLTNENVFLRYVAENLAMIANDLVCDDFDRDEMLEKANEDLRSLGIEV